MTNTENVLEYKCPCCGAGLAFSGTAQKLKCAYCDNEFEMETVREYNDAIRRNDEASVEWQADIPDNRWTEQECDTMRTFTCSSCGGVLITDDNTAATFCPYCGNPTILPGRLSGGIKPNAVLPFMTTKEDAMRAFRNLCHGKKLLPKNYAQENRVEKITGVYVPFWLYDCQTNMDARYNATRIRHWSDSTYNYTKTEHFLLTRTAEGAFSRIPMDASTKMDNAIMEAIEPFDYSKMVDFDPAYLSGFLADKYDVESKFGEERIRQRVASTMNDMIRPTTSDFSSVVPATQDLRVRHSTAKYVLLPVWMLNTRYGNKDYLFAMNGQSGKIAGTFPICPKKSALWFGGICAAVTLLVSLIQLLAG